MTRATSKMVTKQRSLRSTRSGMTSLSIPVPRTRSLSPNLRNNSNGKLSPTCSNVTEEAIEDKKSTMLLGNPCSNKDMRDRSGSICSSPRQMIAFCPQLTPSQVGYIRKSWRHINTKGLVTALARVFQRCESSCPAVSQCFNATVHSLPVYPNQVRTVADHAKYLLNLLDRIVESEIDTEELTEIGAKHFCLKSEFGFTVAEIERFQEVFVEVILKQEGVKQSKETSRAWRLLICSLVDIFRNGYEIQQRNFKRKHSFNAHTRYFENIERRQSMCPMRKASLNVDPRIHDATEKLAQL